MPDTTPGAVSTTPSTSAAEGTGDVSSVGNDTGNTVESTATDFFSHQWPSDAASGNYLHTVHISIRTNKGGTGGINPDGAAGAASSAESAAGNFNAATSAEGGGLGVVDAAVATAGEAAAGFMRNFSQGRTTAAGTITLAMTNAPENRISAQWDATDFGLLGAAIEQFRKDASMNDVLESISKNVGTGSEYATRQLASIFNIGKQLGINLPVSDGIQVFTRKVENPFKEQLFKTMNFRSFPMQFKFAPKSAAESATVKDILYQLEYHMHPEKEKIFLRYPSEFKIEYQYKGGKNTWLNELNTCVLTDMKVDYGHNGFMTSFEGGAPTEVTLSLMFKEILLRDRKDIK